MAINSESKPQQPQITIVNYEDDASITYQRTNHSTTRGRRDSGNYQYIDLDFLNMIFPNGRCNNSTDKVDLYYIKFFKFFKFFKFL